MKLGKREQQSVIQILEKAREIISNEDNWVQKSFSGYLVEGEKRLSVYSLDADCFCSGGALLKAHNLEYACMADRIDEAARILAKVILEENPNQRSVGRSASSVLFNYNDTHTHAEVLAIFDKAIQKAKDGS